MSLRTAPCPRCQALIVYGERQCRSCALPFDYGPNPPPEPSADAVVDVLMSVDLPPLPGAPAVTAPSPAAQPRDVDVGTMPGLDNGRSADVGDVVSEDIPGFIDSTLFAAYSPADVDIGTMPGLEATRQADVQVRTRMLSDIDGQPVPVGDVVTQPVVGLFGSDLFRADVDVAAGASASPSLDVTTNSRPTKAANTVGRRVICATCATIHQLSRCPSCGTAAPES